MVVRAVDVAYFGLQLFSLATLPVLTVTFLLKKSGSSKFNPLLPANTVLYSASAFVACLLLFTDHLRGDEPPAMLCQAQSALILSFPPALSALAFALVFYIFRITWHVHGDRTPFLTERQINVLLIFFSYLIFVIMVVASIVVGTRNPVTRRQFYCLVKNDSISTASASLSAIILFATIVLQIWTMFIVWRRYRISRKLGREEIGDLDVPLFIRILSFGIFVFVALILSFMATANFSLVVPDILVASFGPVIFLIFASQDDVLRAWRLKSPLPRKTERNESVVTIHSLRRAQHAARPSISARSISSDTEDLHSYRFPPVSGD